MSDKLYHEIRGEVTKIYEFMADSKESSFLESENAAVFELIKVTVEFWHYLLSANIDSPDDDALRYACESTFAAVDEFCLISSAYRMQPGARRSSRLVEIPSSLTVKNLYISTYRQLSLETTFEGKCRLLLELFKMQMIFAGLRYE